MHRGSSFPEQIGFFRWTLDQQLELTSDELLLLLAADTLLHSHQFLATPFDLCGQKLIVQFECSRAILVGVAEDAHPVEFGSANKVAQFVEFRLCLTGETEDEGSS